MRQTGHHGGVRSSEALTPTPPGVSPSISTELTRLSSGSVSLSSSVAPPLLLKWIEPTFPETTVSLVNALRSATRRMMRNGAMTCRLSRLDNAVMRQET